MDIKNSVTRNDHARVEKSILLEAVFINETVANDSLLKLNSRRGVLLSFASEKHGIVVYDVSIFPTIVHTYT